MKENDDEQAKQTAGVDDFGLVPAVRRKDTYYCTGGCGERRRSKGEVRQEERDETCLYVCTACGKVADPLPF
jgi:hypothetical protein